jgi:hypothetical protein
MDSATSVIYRTHRNAYRENLAPSASPIVIVGLAKGRADG